VNEHKSPMIHGKPPRTHFENSGLHFADSVVGIATRYRLDFPGIESRWGTRFSAPLYLSAPGAYPASYTLGTGCFPGLKRPGLGVVLPPPSSAEVKD
jgi:hypothetical protein